MSAMDESTGPSGRQAERRGILQSLFGGLISLQLAAEQLASLSLEENGIESGIYRTWQAIVGDAKETTDHHETLSELLVSISRLPPAEDQEGNQLMQYDLRIWGKSCLRGLICGRRNAAKSLTLDDIPCFAWELYDDWRYCMVTSR